MDGRSRPTRNEAYGDVSRSDLNVMVIHRGGVTYGACELSRVREGERI